MAVTFDLATKVISNDQKIWAIFPGKGRSFLGTFLERGVVFLDMPGIALTPAVLQDDKLLRKHVAMSWAISAYHNGELERPPSRRATNYDAPKGKPFNSAVGNVRSMFAKIGVGDLVVMGDRSIYRPVHIGEITKAFETRDVTPLPVNGREEVPIRKVRWLNTNVERRELSERLSRLLSNRHSIIVINKEEFADEVYQIAYGDYVYRDDSRYVFPGPRYKNFAPAIVPGIDLISYFMGAANALQDGELEEFAALEIQEAVGRYFEQDALYSFEIDFASPGGYVVHARQASLALLVALLVAATADANLTYAEAQSAAVVNSADHAQAAQPARPQHRVCDPIEIQNKYRSIMRAIGAVRYNQACAKNKDAQDGVGLRTRVKRKRRN
ncbi:MAG: hypothetical protein ACT4OG_02770 [Alphaproteobacteria bacterium]